MSAKEFSPGAIAEGNMEWAAKIAKMVENLGDLVLNLSSLEDVALNQLAAGDILKYNGSEFVNLPLVLSALADVELQQLEAGDILQYNGSKFVNVQDDVIGFRFFEDENVIQCSYTYSDIVGMIDDGVEIVVSYKGSNCVEYGVNESDEIVFKFISFVDGDLVVDNIIVGEDDSITKETEVYEMTPVVNDGEGL